MVLERQPPAETQRASSRLLALDALRGLTVLLMLLVNNMAIGDATPEQLMHAPFGGVSLADLVFPWFLFCMGASIPYSASSFAKAGLPAWRYYARVLSRSALLFAFGLFLTSSLAHRPVFALDVLQLIALAYLVAALLYRLAPQVGALLLLAGVLLVGYWAATRFVPVPGVGPGIFEEDRNLLLYLNRSYLEPLGLRGLLSVVPTAALALLGAAVSQILRKGPGPGDPLLLLGLGGLEVAVGYAWSLDLPFSKAYWTPPYILLSAGLATLLLAGFYFLLDRKGWRFLAWPLTIPGSNALLAYLAPILLKVWVLQEWTLGQQTLQQAWLGWLVERWGTVGGGWLYTLAYILSWWLVLAWLYRRRIFLRV
jgi:predicted acyltransferase